MGSWLHGRPDSIHFLKSAMTEYYNDVVVRDDHMIIA